MPFNGFASNTRTIRSGSGIRLATELDFPSSLASPISGTDSNLAVNTTAGLTEMLGRTGSHAIEYLELANMALESTRIKLTIDGVVKWDDTFTLLAANLILCGAQDGAFASAVANTPFICEKGFSLEVNMSADTSIDLLFLVRKIIL